MRGGFLVVKNNNMENPPRKRPGISDETRRVFAGGGVALAPEFMSWVGFRVLRKVEVCAVDFVLHRVPAQAARHFDVPQLILPFKPRIFGTFLVGRLLAPVGASFTSLYGIAPLRGHPGECRGIQCRNDDQESCGGKHDFLLEARSKGQLLP